MEYCHYTFQGQEFNSYHELLNKLDEYFRTDGANELESINDVVYSKSNFQDVQKQRIDKIRQDNLKFATASLVNGAPIFEGNKLSVLEFLDSPECKINTRQLVTPFNINDYIEESTKHYIEKQGLDESDARALVYKEIEQWENIKDDAKYVHILGDGSALLEDDDAVFKEKVKNIIPEKFNNVLIKLKDQLKYTYIKEKGKYKDSIAVKNLNIKAKLKEIDKDIFGHIDWLFVGQDGVLHAYVIKSTSQSPRDWTRVKVDKYKYELAFLSQMLANNGINVKNIDLNIIPVQLGYNGKNLNYVRVHNVEQYSSKRSGNGYAMDKYDKAVAHFVTSNAIPQHISSEPIKRAEEVSKAIFPTLNLRVDGIGKSAEEWIQYAPSVDPEGTEPLVITQVNEIDHAYEVKINGKVTNITSNKPRKYNKEILKLVRKHVTELDDKKGYTTQRLKDAIINSFDKGFMTFSTVPGLKSMSIQLEAVLGKYFADYEEDEQTKKKIYKWEILPDLVDANVIAFRNKDTNKLDLILLSAFDIRAKADIKKGQKNILAAYKYDSEYIDLEGDYGNVEAVRAMELLNEILPQLGNVKLGTLGVLSTINNAPYRAYNIGEFNKNYFQNILSIVNSENKGLNAKNNFVQATFSDPVEDIISEYNRITEGKSDSYKKEYDQFGFEELANSENTLAQQRALENILTDMQRQYTFLSDPELVEKAIDQNTNQLTHNIATLYELVARAYIALRGETPKNKNSLNKMNTLFFTAPTVDDENIRIVVDNLQITHDTVAEEFIKEYDNGIRRMFDTFYDKCGYSKAQNYLIGNQTAQFSNLIDPDEELMSFKNPYDMSNDLKTYERELLKEVLYRLDKINRNGNSKFSSPNDAKIADYIEKHPEYLWVPLERASGSSVAQSKESILASMKNFAHKVKNASESFDEFVQGVTSEERELLGNDKDSFYNMTLKNPFSLSMPTSAANINSTIKSRKNMLDKYGKGFFETNVESLLVDFLAKHISTTQYNKLLVASKALLLELHLTGNYNGNKDTVDKEIKYIQDYLKVNVFKTSIMTPAEKKIVGIITPLKRVVSHMLIGGNLISALRDCIEGAEQNFIRSVIKLNTDLDPKDVSAAYAYVWKNSKANAMSQNLLSKLCLRYRISNTDVGRIAERAKTSRNGIYNFSNIMYSTLRCPDFLNRMTLFVAKCMHDGVWEAISLDADNNLVYDWTKDARFKDFKHGVVGSPEYKKAKAAYFSRIREYNQEHPDAPLAMTDNLPEPYSRRSINAIRSLGDNIYGSYDKGKKQMVENASYGVVFGTFITWMNGIVNNYFMSTQKNGVSMMTEEQEVDEQGRKLFFDENGNITNDDTGMPVTKNVPVIVQGILPTFNTLINIAKDGGISETMKFIKGNKMVKANVFKATSDALMWLLLMSLFKLIFSPAYADYKKTMPDNPVLVNLLTEILYKSTSRSYDQFKGPINVIQYFGENMNPPFYSAPANLIKQTGGALFGDKSWKYVIFNNTGFTRSMKDTGFAYIKSQE